MKIRTDVALSILAMKMMPGVENSKVQKAGKGIGSVTFE